MSAGKERQPHHVVERRYRENKNKLNQVLWDERDELQIRAALEGMERKFIQGQYDALCTILATVPDQATLKNFLRAQCKEKITFTNERPKVEEQLRGEFKQARDAKTRKVHYLPPELPNALLASDALQQRRISGAKRKHSESQSGGDDGDEPTEGKRRRLDIPDQGTDGVGSENGDPEKDLEDLYQAAQDLLAPIGAPRSADPRTFVFSSSGCQVIAGCSGIAPRTE